MSGSESGVQGFGCPQGLREGLVGHRGVDDDIDDIWEDTATSRLREHTVLVTSPLGGGTENGRLLAHGHNGSPLRRDLDGGVACA